MNNRLDKFILKEKFNAVFPLREPFIFAVKIIILLFTLLNSYGFFFILKYSRLKDSNVKILQILNTFVLLIIVLKDFIPTIVFPKYNLPNYLPVNAKTKFKLLIYFELINFTSFNFLIFYITTLILSPSSNLLLAQGIICILIGNIGSALLRHVIFFVNRKKILYLIFLICTLLLLIYFVSIQNMFSSFICLAFQTLMGLVYLILLYFLLKKRMEINYDHKIQNAFFTLNFVTGKNLFFKLQLQSYGKVLIIGFTLKSIILFLNYLSLIKKGKYIFDSLFLYNLFLSPIIVFSYVFNNLFGYIHTLNNNILLRSNTLKPLIKLYFWSLLLPVFCDLIISGVIYALSNSINFLYFIKYFCQLSLLSAIGLYGSLNYPIKIIEKFSFKTFYYSSPLITGIGIGIIVLSTIFHKLILYLILPFISIFLILYISGNFKKYRYLIASKLM